MKKSDYHQIVGVLTVAGRNDLVEAIKVKGAKTITAEAGNRSIKEKKKIILNKIKKFGSFSGTGKGFQTPEYGRAIQELLIDNII